MDFLIFFLYTLSCFRHYFADFFFADFQPISYWRFGNLGNAAYLCTMFINKSKNKSGSISVRVLQKWGRNNVMVRSFGSSTDQTEIDRMVEQAREFIARQTGTFYNLFNPPPKQEVSDFIESLSNDQISIVGPKVVFGKLFDFVGFWRYAENRIAQRNPLGLGIFTEPYDYTFR